MNELKLGVLVIFIRLDIDIYICCELIRRVEGVRFRC